MKIQILDEIKHYEIPELYEKEWGNDLTTDNNETDILSVIYSKIPKDILKRYPKLRYLVIRDSDIDKVPDGFKEKHITVCSINLPIVKKNVAEWCFKHIRKFDGYRNLRYCIYGYGRIGHKLEAIMTKRPNCIEEISTIQSDENKEYITSALKYSDVITIHMPLNKSTRKMFNKDMFKKMKKGVKIINTCSTSIMVLEDLKKAVDDEIVDLYISDTMYWRDVNDLHQCGNYILNRGRIAWFSPEVRYEMTQATIDTINSCIEGSPINVYIEGDKRWF